MSSEKLSKEKQDYKIHETEDWIDALQLALPIFIIILYYHYVRRGIFLPFFIENDISFIYLANKAFALTAVVMVVISVLIGPLASFFPSLGKKIGVRKEIGVVGFLLGIVHMILSFLYSSWSFNAAFLTGFLGLIFFSIIVLFAGTKQSMINLGYKKWKAIQRLVWVALIFIVFHILVLGNLAGWKKWLSDPMATYYLPPGGLVITIFIFVGFLFRLIVFIKDRIK